MSKIFSGKRSSILAVLMLLMPVLLNAYDGGTKIGGKILQPPPGVTGAFGEPLCTQCHTGTGLNAGGGKLAITVSSSSGAAAISYSSGSTYQINITVSDSAQQKWGFELSARTLSGQQAGLLMIGNDGFTQILTSFNNVQYIAHTFAGTRTGTKSGATFSFTWTAPNISAGEVDFYAAANAANGDLSPDFDHIYNTFVRLQPQAPPPPPSINAQGIVNNASFTPGTTPLSAGTIAAIFGKFLDDGSANPYPTIGSDGKISTTLGGASVSFNGVAAPIFAAFLNQLDVQIPYELTGLTSAAVVVTVDGQASPMQMVPFAPFSPGVFTYSSTGQGQGTVQFANSTVVAAAPGSVAEVQSRPANPGDILTIYCTGLGDVTNRPVTGSLSPTDPLARSITPPSVTIGGVNAPSASFSGLAPGFAGLYQINVQVPPGVPAGDSIPLIVSVGGVPSLNVSIAVAAAPSSRSPPLTSGPKYIPQLCRGDPGKL